MAAVDKSGRLTDALRRGYELSGSTRHGDITARQLKVPIAARPIAASAGKGDRKTGTPQPKKSTTQPANAARKTGDEFGLAGTNKTVAKPKPDNAPPDELGLGPHVEKSPYTRG